MRKVVSAGFVRLCGLAREWRERGVLQLPPSSSARYALLWRTAIIRKKAAVWTGDGLFAIIPRVVSQKSIWEQIRADPESGARSLVDAYSQRLYRLAYRLCENVATAEDLAIRTISRAVKATGDFPSESAYFSFLCSILVNLHRDDLRLKGANALVFCDELPEVEAVQRDPADDLMAQSDAEAVRFAVSRLSPLLRETVVLRYYTGLSIADIAAVQVVPEGTVKFRLSEARRKIREIFTQRNCDFTR